MGLLCPSVLWRLFSYQATLKEGNLRCNAFFQEVHAICAVICSPQDSLLSGKSFVNSSSGYEGPLSSAATKCSKNRDLHFQATKHGSHSPEEQHPQARRKGWQSGSRLGVGCESYATGMRISSPRRSATLLGTGSILLPLLFSKSLAFCNCYNCCPKHYKKRSSWHFVINIQWDIGNEKYFKYKEKK